jgi:hypothetical protein
MNIIFNYFIDPFDEKYILYIKSLVACVHASDDVLGAFSMAELATRIIGSQNRPHNKKLGFKCWNMLENLVPCRHES